MQGLKYKFHSTSDASLQAYRLVKEALQLSQLQGFDVSNELSVLDKTAIEKQIIKGTIQRCIVPISVNK